MQPGRVITLNVYQVIRQPVGTGLETVIIRWASEETAVAYIGSCMCGLHMLIQMSPLEAATKKHKPMTACTLEQTETVIRGRCQCPSWPSKSQWTGETGNHWDKKIKPPNSNLTMATLSAVALHFYFIFFPFSYPLETRPFDSLTLNNKNANCSSLSR